MKFLLGEENVKPQAFIIWRKRQSKFSLFRRPKIIIKKTEIVKEKKDIRVECKRCKLK